MVLAVIVFIISNVIDRSLNADKERLVGKIGSIEKSHEAYLRYNSMATNNFNFAQLHLNAVMESTVNGQTHARPFFMTHVTDQISRAIRTYDEAAGSLVDDMPDEDKDLISTLSSSGTDGEFETFYQAYMHAFKRTGELQTAVAEKMRLLGDEKASAQLNVARIESKQSVLLNITMAINFLILLFGFIEKHDKKDEMA